ncbi:MAG: NAD-dependent epimerase/dehydratase family protein, partial [Campylobacteraceae bacterium]|nr:NAD-dependent epimerase/dehydratase family protein [Campylobacteraceae bacterium]
MKQIVVTGCRGFIGSYFIGKYSKDYNIKVFSFRNDSLENLILTNTSTILHLSALVHQMGGASKEEYERINISQTLDLAKKAKENGVRHFIFMSTVKVYGEETSDIYTEESSCIPEDNYGKSKLKAEVE